MEWDFTPSDVISGKVNYSQEEFLRDLKEEVQYNFTKATESEIEQITHLNYTACYYTAIQKGMDELSKIIKIPESLLREVQESMKGNTKMLEAIIMRKFLENLKVSGGLLGDLPNMELVNAQLRNFHKKYHL